MQKQRPSLLKVSPGSDSNNVESRLTVRATGARKGLCETDFPYECLETTSFESECLDLQCQLSGAHGGRAGEARGDCEATTCPGPSANNPMQHGAATSFSVDLLASVCRSSAMFRDEEIYVESEMRRSVNNNNNNNNHNDVSATSLDKLCPKVYLEKPAACNKSMMGRSCEDLKPSEDSNNDCVTFAQPSVSKKGKKQKNRPWGSLQEIRKTNDDYNLVSRECFDVSIVV